MAESRLGRRIRSRCDSFDLSRARPALTARLRMVEDDEEREPFQLSLAQVAASSLAAVSAAVVCSFFGVAGTVIGTAVASLVATIGGALYSFSLRRTRARLRRLHRAGAAAPPLREVLRTMQLQSRDILRRVRWGVVGIGTGTVFVFSIGVVTLIEGSAGEPLTALIGATHGGSGTTSLNSIAGTNHHRRPSPSPTPSPSESASNSPSPSPSRTPTNRPPSTTPTATPSPPPPTLPLPTLPGIGSSTPTQQPDQSSSPGAG